ncbi:MAG: type IX secretion system membrane protein PorP/SprF [Flavobacteriales bacterium]|nr:type IX secretion system membrane protein PorP/SprF [Flavobacteriales bacterium]
MYDKIGRSSTSTIKGQYSYLLRLTNGTLGLGVSAGLVNFKLGAFNENETIDGAAIDPTIPTTDINESKFDMDVGLYYQSENFFAGFSSTHLTDPLYSNFYQVKRHFYLTTGYKIGSAIWTTEPSLLIKTDLTSTQIDLNNLITYNDMFILGTGYRHQDALIFSTGVKLGVFQFLYAYDYGISALSSFHSGSHEINLKITINNTSDETRLTK